MSTKDSLLKVEIMSPQGSMFNGTALSISLPGEVAPFVVLPMHAPIVSALESGTIVLKCEDGEKSFNVTGGFVEVHDNIVLVCIS